MENGQLKRINMCFNYKLAAEIINCFDSVDISCELDMLVQMQCLDSEQLIKTIFDESIECILKPNKYTLLHCFIEQYLYNYLMNERYYLLDELCDDLDADTITDFISKTVKILNEYGITITDYEERIHSFAKECEEGEDPHGIQYKELVGRIYDDILDKFDEIEHDVVEAVFYLLYNNKGFLYQFNQYLTNYTAIEFLDEKYFDSFNHIKRCNYIPEWLKRAVFYRDNGKCQHCGKDLTGIVAIYSDKALQFDHIIPLGQGGTNDATNFQLLCSDCNLQKSGNIYQPNYLYQMYW